MKQTTCPHIKDENNCSRKCSGEQCSWCVNGNCYVAYEAQEEKVTTMENE